MRFVSVAVPVPFLEALTYAVPDDIALPQAGARVLVPVGGRLVTGCIVDSPVPAPDGAVFELTGAEGRAPDAKAIKPIADVIDREPVVPLPLIELCRWVADYYVCGIGDACAAALPPGSRQMEPGSPRLSGRFRTRRVAALSAHGVGVAEAVARGTPLDGERLTAGQRAALDALAGAPMGLPVSALKERGITAATLSRLAARGLVGLRQETEERDPFERAAMADVTPDASRVLSDEQQRALDHLTTQADRGQFGVSMLRGVTGSGKTEVYLRLAQHVRRSGRQVLLLVPEIGLTPALAGLVRGAFGDRVAIQHSALSDGERHDQWHRIRRGDVDVVIGTRSAVFTPLSNVGLIVVDEEHDASYKQDETPRYHGRDVAVMRASRERALVVLASATPSVETCHNAAAGKYQQALIERRVHDRQLATVRIVDMRQEQAELGPDAVLSRPLIEGIDDRLVRQEQVMVLLNRRGFATSVFCRQCGDVFECPNCSVSLTVHIGRGRRTAEPGDWSSGTARCHYCNYAVRVPRLCRKCASPYLEQAGFGTEKVEQQIAARFPGSRVARVDRDAVRRKGALTTLLSRFAAGEIDVLVGTQMIAKGHDFPRVTLVGVVSADVGLGMADFRAAERTFQLLTQVAGRAGRGERPGEAIVQTLFPEHYSIQLACRQDYSAFFEKESDFRRRMRYPPAVAMVNAVVRGRTLEQAFATAHDIVGALAPYAGSLGFTTLGPAPAPLARLKGEHRVQFFLKGPRRADMRQSIRTVLAERPELRRRVTVDVDPLNML